MSIALLDVGERWGVAIEPTPDVSILEPLWKKVEHSAHASFFQSWPWIGCWLECLPRSIATSLLRINRDGETVGIAILAEARATQFKIFPTRELFVNESGNTAFDAVTIEHNSVVIGKHHEAEVIPLLLEYFYTRGLWDQINISGIPEPVASCYVAAAQRLGMLVRQRQLKPYYFVDLAALNDENKTYMSILSGNTRYQIRRAQREYSKTGNIAIESARDVGQALDYLSRLKELHQNYWNRKGYPGAFSSSFAAELHSRIIANGFDCGAVQLLRISAGEMDIGYLYNFIKDGIVYSYQSGFAYEQDKKLKPGLVSHSLAIEYNATLGNVGYDFLAGESQYKESLSTSRGEMCWLTLQKPRLRFRLEHHARKFKNRVTQKNAVSN